MMYCNKMAASVKVGGKVMREQGETVFLPFGEEYSLFFKNLSGQRALVKVEIDGENVAGGGLIIDPNCSIDFERFILDGDLKKGPKFKFVEKTERISDHRGDKTEDGLVRISYRFEKPVPLYSQTTWYSYDSGWPTVYGNSTLRGSVDTTFSAQSMTIGGAAGEIDGFASAEVSASVTMDSAPVNDAGITAKGDDSTQKFQYAYIGALEETEHVIVFQLKGQVGDVPVAEPLTVKKKVKCDLCGKKNKSTNKFCTECGNNLTY